MEVSVRHQKTPLWRHFLSRVSKLAYFVEHDIGYQSSKFQCSRMYGSNFMEGGWNPPPPPPVLQGDKSTLLNRLSCLKSGISNSRTVSESLIGPA